MLSYPPLLLLVATVTVTVTATTYFNFDDLCGVKKSQKLDNHPLSVVLTDVKERRSDATTCICFSPGVYEYHDSTDCDYHDDDNDEDSTSTPLVLDLPGCFQLPHSARALRKRVSRSRQESPITMTSVFPSCNKGEPRKRRVKRQEAPPAEGAPAAEAPPAAAAAPAAGGAAAPAAAPGGGPAPPNAMIKTVLNDTFDEDFSSTGTEIGHELMRNQMNQYIENVITKLTGLSGGDSGVDANQNTRNHKYPVIRLLDYTKQIMQRTCAVVSGDFLDLAMNAFVNLQLDTYHIKEPYIGYSAYKRIEKAMHRCLASADPHVFLMPPREGGGGGGDAGGNGTSAAAAGGNGTQAGGSLPSEMCDNHVPHQTSNQTVLRSGTDAEEIKNILIPEYASSILNAAGPSIAEPLIETVWKMLVSTHSYCYIFFSDYFNDHHTYTVALLPLFTNAIQSIWLNDDGKGYELKEGNKLYGGLLGNIKKILTDVDLCVGASRAISPYPWFMNRPLLDKSNVWRRKRSIQDNDDDHQSLLFDDEGEKVVGRAKKGIKPSLSHVCTKNVPRERVCGNGKK